MLLSVLAQETLMLKDEPKVMEQRPPPWKVFDQNTRTGIQSLRGHRGFSENEAGRWVDLWEYGASADELL